MNREIKFNYIWKRGDSIATGLYTIEDIEKGAATAPRIRDGSIIQDWELLARRQFTGLKDKNGVEIYQGDIVIVTRVEQCDTDNEKEIVIIGSPEYLELSDWDTGGPENVWVVTEKEVIGNIHQNPELMEE